MFIKRNLMLIPILVLVLVFTGCLGGSTLKNLVLTGDADQVEQGKLINLEVKGFDQKNKEVTIPRLNWESVDESKGTLAVNGSKAIFTANAEATGKVIITVTAGKVSDSFEITIIAADIPEPEEVDLIELEGAITEAEALIANTGKGEGAGEAPEAAHTALQDAIDVAKLVYNDAEATQTDVDNAVIALNTAIIAFEEAIVEEQELDFTSLNAAIADAEALKNTPVGIYKDDAPVHAHAALQAAIDAASQAKDDPAATQITIDSAVTSLTTAIADFNLEIVTKDDPLKVNTFTVDGNLGSFTTNDNRGTTETNTDPKYIKTGTESIHLAATGTPYPLRVRVNHPDWVEDWTEYDHLAAWFYVEDVEALHKDTTIQISQPMDNARFTLKRSEFVSGWNEIVLSLRDDIGFTNEELSEMDDFFEFIIRYSGEAVSIYFDEIRLLQLEEVAAELIPYVENFDVGSSNDLLSTSYKTLPTDSTKPMYIAKSGGGKMSVTDGIFQFSEGRLVIGALDSTDTTKSDTTGNGVFDLTKPYRIKIITGEATGAKRFQVQIDNNTSGGANSGHGSSCRIFNENAENIANTTIVIESNVGYENSQILFRTENGAMVQIKSFTIEYQ